MYCILNPHSECEIDSFEATEPRVAAGALIRPGEEPTWLHKG